MVQSAVLGFPRIGKNRELKKALESFWAGKIPQEDLEETAKKLRREHWLLQKEAGIDLISVNDFSYYDQVLDTAIMVGAIADRFKPIGKDSLKQYFAMARGLQSDGHDLAALEMTKWFDTNYHYLVPEIAKNQDYEANPKKVLSELEEAKALEINPKPVIIGPVSFLLLSKVPSEELEAHLQKLLPVYTKILSALKTPWIQIDEPCLVTDLSDLDKNAYLKSYRFFANQGLESKLLLTSYFASLGDNLDLTLSLPIDGLHLDLTRAPEELDRVLLKLPPNLHLSLGVVDGRNIWRTDLEKALQLVKKAEDIIGHQRLVISSSCSLLHSPIDKTEEKKLDAEFLSWLAFAKDKLHEISILARSLREKSSNFPLFIEAKEALDSRRSSPRVHNAEVKRRLQTLTPSMSRRKSSYKKRQMLQKSLGLPLFPTTTIGSFPQTVELRAKRAAFRAGTLAKADYDVFVAEQIRTAVRWQEEIGIDVFVHGEFERNDMVEYFGECLEGFAFTENAWVQSYGSRCVKPPIIFGDVYRSSPMTVKWSRFAQSLTKAPMKGMLTGPVTILQWSFVRDDQERKTSCQQIALAIRDEVVDLEAAGLRIIQIDEPAIREGLPLRRAERQDYLDWAVECFRIASTPVDDSTQIHTHMCYSEFNDIIHSVAEMDADAVSIETSRSKMELLDTFAHFKYPNEVGPGVYDIHSPRIPSEDEMVDLLRAAAKVLDPKQIWVNPDCGLKTRSWIEVKPALVAMVNAAKRVRTEV